MTNEIQTLLYDKDVSASIVSTIFELLWNEARVKENNSGLEAILMWVFNNNIMSIFHQNRQKDGREKINTIYKQIHKCKYILNSFFGIPALVTGVFDDCNDVSDFI